MNFCELKKTTTPQKKTPKPLQTFFMFAKNFIWETSTNYVHSMIYIQHKLDWFEILIMGYLTFHRT